jgi:hypothetical protein
MLVLPNGPIGKEADVVVAVTAFSNVLVCVVTIFLLFNLLIPTPLKGLS